MSNVHIPQTGSDSSPVASSSEIFIRPIELGVTFEDYCKLKFKAMQKGILLSKYIKELLADEDFLVETDPQTLELLRHISSFVNDIDYSIIWVGDGFWRVKRHSVRK